MSDQIQEIQTKLIDPGPNHRIHFDEGKLQELAESIKANGLAQPITVRPMPNGRYQIVAGERRFRACDGILHWATIPAIVRELDDEQAHSIMLVENTGRVDLNPMEEAWAYERSVEVYGWTITKTAEKAGVSASKVTNRLKLLKLNEDIQRLVASGNMPVGLAEELSVLDSNRQRIAMRWLNNQPSTPTRATFGKVIGELYAEQQQESLFDLSNFTLQPQIVAALEEGDGHLRSVLPKRKELPELPNRNGSMGAIIDNYLVELLAAGHSAEASVIMDFWAKLMESNYAVLPAIESKLLAQHGLTFQNGKTIKDRNHETIYQSLS